MKARIGILLILSALLPACDGGKSDPTAPAAPAAPTATPGDGQVTLTWSVVAGATSYAVYYASQPGVTPQNYASLPGGTAIPSATSPQTVAGLTNGVAWYFVVTASNAAGEGPPSPEATATPQLAPPVFSGTLVVIPGAFRATLTWPAATGATSYVVYQAEAPGVGPLTWAGLPGGRRRPVLSSPFEIRGLTAGTTYFFKVVAVNAAGESGPSNEASGIPHSGGAPVPYPLTFRPVDAQYDLGTDRIFAVEFDPHRLHALNPSTGAVSSVALNLRPRCLAVTPDGAWAAVGHDGWISAVNLTTLTLERTVRVEADAWDIVAANGGIAYVSSKGRGLLQRIDLNTGAVAAGDLTDGREAVVLNPAGTRISTVTSRSSPADLHAWDVTGAAPVHLGDSPYHGEHSMRYPLWTAPDGGRVYTAAATVFLTSAGAPYFTHEGNLATTSLIASLDHTPDTVVVAPAIGFLDNKLENMQLKLYDRATLALSTTIPLPARRWAGNAWGLFGRYVFVDSTAQKSFVLAESAREAELPTNWALAECALPGSGAAQRAPTGLRALHSSPGLVTVQGDTLPEATGYTIYYARVSGVLPGNWTSLPGGGQTVVSVPWANIPVMPGQTYYFVATATGPGGTSEPSPEVEATYAAMPSTSPQNLTATPKNGGLTLNWTPVAGASEYTVFAARRALSGIEDDVDPLDAENCTKEPGGVRVRVAAPPFDLMGLLNDRVYFVGVEARSGPGPGPYTATVQGVPTAGPAVVIDELDYYMYDARYSRALNRIVAISQSPALLHLYDPQAQTETTLALPLEPWALALEPGGLSAVVGHTGGLTRVNLVTMTQTTHWATLPEGALSIEVGPGGIAYISGFDYWLRRFDLSNGNSTTHTTFTYRLWLRSNLAGTALYYTSSTSVGSDLFKADIASIPPVELYRDPYVLVEFDTHGKVWTSDNGAFLVSASGNAFSTTSVQATDLRYRGRVNESGAIGWADTFGAQGDLAIGGGGPYQSAFVVLDDVYFQPLKAAAVPRLLHQGALYNAWGRFVFFRADGSEVYGVAEPGLGGNTPERSTIVTLKY